MVTSNKLIRFNLISPSEKSIVDATIAFLNGAEIRMGGMQIDYIGDLTPFELSIKTLSRQVDALDKLPEFENAEMFRYELAQDTLDSASPFRLRVLLRALFSALVHDATQKSNATRMYLAKNQFTIVLKGEAALCTTRTGAIEIVHNYALESTYEVVITGEALLLDHAKQFGKDLCQCKLCRNFFLVEKPKTGRPQRIYCSRNHANQAHKATAPIRKRNSLRKKAEDKMRSKRRRAG